jgi:DNA-binding protein
VWKRKLSWVEKVAKELMILLDEPTHPSGVRHTQSYRAVRAVVDSMAAALKRGEKVNVPGIGTWRKVLYDKKFVVEFYPSLELVKMVKESLDEHSESE